MQRPLDNWALNFALVFETVLAFLIIYLPGSSQVTNLHYFFYIQFGSTRIVTKYSTWQGLQLAPLSPLWWLPGFAFSLVLILYEELRKAITRKHPTAWTAREMQY